MVYKKIIFCLLFMFAYACGENVPLAQHIISNYEQIKNNVIVKYTFYDNPESYTLDDVAQRDILVHINLYLDKKYSDKTQQITVVMTNVDGFIKINGEMMYTVVPISNSISMCRPHKYKQIRDSTD